MMRSGEHAPHRAARGPGHERHGHRRTRELVEVFPNLYKFRFVSFLNLTPSKEHEDRTLQRLTSSTRLETLRLSVH